MPETEMIDRLFLELSQFTNATTGKERHLKAQLARARACIAFFASVIKSGEAWSPTCEKEMLEAMEE